MDNQQDMYVKENVLYVPNMLNIPSSIVNIIGGTRMTI